MYSVLVPARKLREGIEGFLGVSKALDTSLPTLFLSFGALCLVGSWQAPGSRIHGTSDSPERNFQHDPRRTLLTSQVLERKKKKKKESKREKTGSFRFPSGDLLCSQELITWAEKKIK